MKTCPHCKAYKPTEEYFLYKGKPKGRCKPCQSEYNKTFYKYRDRSEYYQTRKEHHSKVCSEWRKNNKDKRNSYNASRRSRLKQAEPSWLSDKQREEIVEVYSEAQRLTASTGVPHHVDHVVPLCGENVSGLHVPWNLKAIPAEENLRKSNRT